MPEDLHALAPQHATTVAAPAKRVFVIGNAFDAQSYLKQQSLSTGSPKPAADGVKIITSTDGIQFYASDAKLLKKLLEPNSSYQPDAIVLTDPGAGTLQNAGTIDDLYKLKNRFPSVQILVDGLSPRNYIATDDARYDEIKSRSFAIPHNEAAVIHDHRKPVTITQGDANYYLAHPIDRMCVNSRDKANDLRDLLGMEHLTQRGR